MSAVFENGRQGLIDEKGNERNDKSLANRKGQIKNAKSGENAVHRGQNCLIHSENCLLGKTKLVVERINQEIVEGNAQNSHGKGGRNRGNHRAAAGFVIFINRSGRECKNRAHNEVGKLAHARRLACEKVKQIFKQANEHTVKRAECKGAHESRKIGKVEFDKARHNGN